MKIIRRELPAKVVYEDDDTLAFLDIAPVNPGHTLVVPKQPFRNIFDMDEAAVLALARTTQKVAAAVKEATGAGGVNVTMNNEAVAGQVVFHAHMHVIPRFENDGCAPWPKKEYRDGEADALAEKIRAAFN